MSTIYGTVLSKEIDVDIKKREGGFYKGYRIVYKNEQGEIKPLEKAMASLKYSPSVEAALQGITVGDEITIVQEKNDKGFLDVKALQKGKQELGGDIIAQTISVPSATGNRTYAQGKVLGSTYETPEERKLKQRLIVRQAALNQALEFTTVGRSEPVDIDEVKNLAEQFETWVYRDLV